MSRTFKKRDNKKFKKVKQLPDQEGKYVPRKRENRFKGKKSDDWDD